MWQLSDVECLKPTPQPWTWPTMCWFTHHWQILQTFNFRPYRKSSLSPNHHYLHNKILCCVILPFPLKVCFHSHKIRIKLDGAFHQSFQILPILSNLCSFNRIMSCFMNYLLSGWAVSKALSKVLLKEKKKELCRKMTDTSGLLSLHKRTWSWNNSSFWLWLSQYKICLISTVNYTGFWQLIYRIGGLHL